MFVKRFQSIPGISTTLFLLVKQAISAKIGGMLEESEILRLDSSSTPSDELLHKVAQLFQRNYPTMHDQEEREEDIGLRNSSEKLRELLKGKVLRVARDSRQQVIGVLESCEVDAGDFIYALLIWLIVDEKARGQKVSSKLHNVFEEEIEARRTETGKEFVQLLNVHEANSARQVYERWGYVVIPPKPKRPHKLFMAKEKASAAN